ncbi:EF-hand domain-containing protein [Roseiarcaceae bacterium H3SJ34-1]|uniref:EF-hand domain-containing protein n=1 Tax=Terripilifer ovatus TaxID=3032367 RepID=UPI003AB984E5|nr:EF-hand domain-containing protein [Roseiarcaceae bacterium H3SJ34-1]
MRFILGVSLIALSLSGCAAVARSALAAGNRPDISQMLANADENGDGKISRGEFTDARARLFARIDRNGDGFLSKDDVPQGLFGRRRGGERLQQAITMLDKDGDGRISRDEFVNGPGLLFDRADANHDGVVDARELATLRAVIAARKSQ